MTEKLDPTNQGDWEKFEKEFGAAMDAALEGANGEGEDHFGNIKIKETLSESAVNAGDKPGESHKIGVQIAHANKIIRKKETLSQEEKKLRDDLDALMGQANFGKKSKREDITEAIRILRNEALKKIKAKGEISGSEEEKTKAIQIMYELAEKKSKSGDLKKTGLTAAMRSISDHLGKEKSDKIAKDEETAKKLAEEKKTSVPKKVPESKPEGKKIETVIELTDAEKEDALKFFKEHIATMDVYNIGKSSNKGIEEFFKEQFIETADTFNFLDGDGLKINLAWELIAKEIPARIKELEGEAKKNEKDNELTLAQIYEKLTAAGASDEDVKYFFNLIKKERLEILNSNGDELRERIKDLAEKRKESDSLNKELARDIGGERIEKENQLKNKDNLLKHFGKEVERCRREYLEKEDSIKIKVSRLKNFFKNFVSVDKNYQVEKELEIYKEEYEKALKNYLDAVVEIEKPADAEEREIIYRYAQFGETLQMMNVKEDMKLEKNPRLENFKRMFGTGTANFLDKYKELLGKPKELIAKKTGSKVLGFGGGIAVVGGAMALAAYYIPGLRNVTLPLGIAVATKCFYERAQIEAVIEKEKLLEGDIEKLESRLEYINDLGAKVDEAFKKELGLATENIPEEVIKEREEIGRRMAKSLVKAIAMSSVFYMLGHAVKEYFSEDDLRSSSDLAKIESAPAIGEKVSEVTSIPGSAVHSQTIVPIIGGGKSIEQIMTDIGIDRPGQQVESAGVLDSKGIESVSPADPVTPEKSDDIFTAEMPSEEVFSGIELDDSGRGKLQIIPGTGIKDTLAKLLVENSEKFTEGKMGWDADKYASVEEWADKRAIGVVEELKEQYPDYNFDKVSEKTEMVVNLSDKENIEIEGLKDQYNLGDGRADISKLEGAVLQSNILETAEQMTNNEMRLAYAAGVSSTEYVRINHLTVAEFLNSNDQPTRELRDIVAAINVTEDDPTNSVAEALRAMNAEDMNKILENRDLSGFNYDDYLKRIVREELMSHSDILRALNDIKDQKITVDNSVFKAFMEATKNTLGEGFAEFEKDQTVREFLIESVKRTYEMGKIDALKVALSHIKL